MSRYSNNFNNDDWSYGEEDPMEMDDWDEESDEDEVDEEEYEETACGVKIQPEAVDEPWQDY
ncbi:hypothetical protein [Thiosulfativibrio zosterae]|uniref:Uncharacterized protein n=1 Tax=Thiosulfativibrio zosterae TaxID=2675053 RepID=A0A6F8PQG8_9GAMM|nr:hypothetical protein [Thiosulfativibrio zosterae]BBP44326.1 hypothetical protein THMIRHAT_20720 [Thiosulfativibrio zosterae]